MAVNTNYEASHYSLFSSLLLLLASSVQISSLAHCYQTPSNYVKIRVSYPRALLFKCHAMKTWRSEILGPPFITLSLDRGEYSAPHLCCCNHRERSSIHCTAGWMYPRTTLNIMEEREIPYPYKQLNTVSSVVQLVAYLYTDLASQPPAIRICSSFNMRVKVSCSCKRKERDKLLLFIF
jgi:hypothetical protein